MLTVDEKITLTIQNLGSSGEGVGRHQGYTIFVEGALPGEHVLVRLVECHQRYGRAELLGLLKPSEDRVKPQCSLFGKCGGCQLMHLSYAKQLEMKTQRVSDALQRIGKINDIEPLACLPSPQELRYRNKIQLPVRMGRRGLSLGLFARSSHDIVEMEECHIHCPLGEEITSRVKDIIKSSGITPYLPATGKGELRHVLIKSAVNNNEALVILVTSKKCSPLLLKAAKEIMLHCKKVKGVVHNLNKSSGNTVLGGSYEVIAGEGFVTEKLSGLLFKVSPASFFQVNPEQAEILYSKVLEFADLEGNETVLDAYCGVGTLALFLAGHCKKVIGVEFVADAIEDAKENAQLNQITNASFECALSETFINTLEHVDTAVLNPPRKGCEFSFLKKLAELGPKKIVYISCDPATLARDLAHLLSFGYDIEEIQPYDMFPQTAHVECVAKLTRT